MFKYYNLSKFFSYNRATVLVAIFISFITAAIIWYAAKDYYYYLATEKFEAAVNENLNSIDKRISKYEAVLRGGIGFFHGSDYVSRQEWHDFIEALDIKKNYPGIQGVGFSKMIHLGEVAELESEMKKDGFETFSIKPSGERQEYSVILYLEPMDKRNIEAIGYDMFSEPTRRAAMETARDSAAVSLSKKVTLVQEIDSHKQSGILMYLPLYKKGSKIDTIEERRKALIGFVYSPFRMNDFMNNIVLERSILSFEVYDDQNISDKHLLYRSFEASSYVPKHHAIKTLNVNNQIWYIHFYSTKEFDNSTDTLYPLVMTTVGLFVQLFLLFIIFLLFKSRDLLKAQTKELQKLSQAVEQSPSTIVITDLEGNIEYANEAFSKTTGYLEEEAIGRNPRFLQSGKTDSEVYNDMWESLKAGKIWHGEFINLTKEGVEYIESVKISPIFQDDGTVSNYMAIKEDITDKKHSEERIYYLANFDSLTGLPNRVQLEERINYAIGTAKRNNGCFSVMFLDLDYFKEINDTLGHDAGDSLLIELGARFKSVLREIDMVSRVGGDEFIFLFLDTDVQGSSYIAKKLLQVIDSPFKLGDNELLVTASIGIAIYPVNGEDKETLFKNADIAMYRAKQEGRNRYCFYSEVYSS